MPVITFKPKQVTKNLFGTIPERARDVIVGRFGLGDVTEKKTLESIGNAYGITRERVRQIESFALAAMRKSDAYASASPVFQELKDIISEIGFVMSEQDLLEYISKDPLIQNHISLYLVLGDDFVRSKETDTFNHRWTIDEDMAKK